MDDALQEYISLVCKKYQDNPLTLDQVRQVAEDPTHRGYRSARFMLELLSECADEDGYEKVLDACLRTFQVRLATTEAYQLFGDWVVEEVRKRGEMIKLDFQNSFTADLN